MFAPLTDTFSMTPDCLVGYLNNQMVMVPVSKGPAGPIAPGQGFGGGSSTAIADLTTLVNGLTTTVNSHSDSIGALNSTVATLNASVTANTASIVANTASITSLTTSVTANTTLLGIVDDTIPNTTGDGVFDNASAFASTVGEFGSFTTGGKAAARLPYLGTYLLKSLTDIHPSHTLDFKARGGTLLVPDGNLSSANADGAQAALLRILRRTPPSSGNLAWGFQLSGVNLDARGVTFASGSFTGATATNLITSTNHGRPNGYALYVTGASLPTGLAKGQMYFVINATTNTFQLSLTSGGAAVVMTADGSGTWAPLVHGIRVPNADPSKNALDPDPTYAGNKDYVAGCYMYGDIVNFPGSGFVGESTNGRLDLHSFRSINNGSTLLSADTATGHGFDVAGNDIVMGGHTAAGGNSGFGIKVGNASGFFATTLNLWGLSASRSLTCGAMWINNRKLFGVGFSEFNDWLRIDGTLNGSRGGVIALNAFGSFNDLFNAEATAIDTTTGGADPRLQAFVGLAAAQSVDFIGNRWTRTTATNKSGQPGGLFGNWQNTGGDLTGGAGTAFNYFIDASNAATVNMLDTVSSAPDIKPWTSPPIAITSITQASPAVVTTTAAHGLQANDHVAFADTGTLGAGIYKGVTYFVMAAGLTSTAFQVSNTPNGAAVATTSASSGTLKCAKLNVLPYNARTGAQINYALFDSFKGEVRLGARGNGVQSKLLLGINDGDTGNLTGIGPLTIASVSGSNITCNGHGLQVGYPVVFSTTGTLPTGLALNVQYWVVTAATNTFQVSATWGGNSISLSGGSGTHTFYSWYRTYGIEAGDHTLLNGNNKRNALWGSWEFDSAPQYTDNTFQRNFYNAGGVLAVNVNAGIHYRRILLSGVYTSVAITLPTNTAGSAFAAMGGSQALRVVITGSGSPVLTWAFSGSGGFDTNTELAPAWIPPGGLIVDLWYERDQNTWQVIGFHTDGGPLGRIDNVVAPAGVVGEQIFSKVTQASAVALTTNVVATVTSIVLTPGDWTVSANGIFSSTSVTSSSTSNVKLSVGTASGAISSADGTGYQSRNTSSTATTTSGTDLDSLGVAGWRTTVAAGTTQTVYLNVKATLVGTVGAWGGLRAIRTT